MIVIGQDVERAIMLLDRIFAALSLRGEIRIGSAVGLSSRQTRRTSLVSLSPVAMVMNFSDWVRPMPTVNPSCVSL